MSSRTGFVGIGLLVAAATSWGAEPERPACWVLAQGTYARECLAVLGRDCVEIVPLPEAAAPADRLPGAKASDGDRPLPAAIVVQVGDDDLAARFWNERLSNQQPVELLVLQAGSTVHPWEQRQRSLRQAHALLVRICPSSKARFDERLSRELSRGLRAAAGGESLAQR